MSVFFKNKKQDGWHNFSALILILMVYIIHIMYGSSRLSLEKLNVHDHVKSQTPASK